MTESRIEFDAPSEIRELISEVGRTEDIRLSPDNKRLALVDFVENRIILFSIRIDCSSSSPKITLLDYCVITSASLRNPHGIAFLDNQHIVVCNRYADVNVFKVPVVGNEGRKFNLNPLKSINGKGYLLADVKSPGSVDCYKIADDSYLVFVCNNHWHFVTSHIITTGDSSRVKKTTIRIENKLKIPDGISISFDRTWIAISNHVHGEVLIFKNTSALDRQTPPSAILRGIVCPHGVRFSPDGKRIFVADAASPYMHVFDNKSGEWDGVQEPSKSVRLVDDEIFYAGRYDTREGGAKGIDIDNSNTVLITTRTHDVVAFYDLNKLLAESGAVDKGELIELCRERDISLERQQKDVLDRQWDLRTRVKHAFIRLRGLRQYPLRVTVRARLFYLYLRNRWSNTTILDPAGPALSLTTHKYRKELVFYAIESIGLGDVKPSRITIWLEDEEARLSLPATLLRLKSRGLEIRYAEDFGPHTKYYPYIDRASEFHTPLVTADDDMLYPRDWLKQLVLAYKANPAAIHCHRAHRMCLNNKRMMPYNEWIPCASRSPSHLNLVTGVSGAIYPPKFLNYLKCQGREFEQCCPKSDDIWLTVNALRAGYKIAQINDFPVHFNAIPGSQTQRLFDENVLAGGNQYQIMRTFSKSDLADLRTHLLAESAASESGMAL